MESFNVNFGFADFTVVARELDPIISSAIKREPAEIISNKSRAFSLKQLAELEISNAFCLYDRDGSNGIWSPVSNRARRSGSADDGTAPLVFFDLEATGVIQWGSNSLPDIIQIAAVGPDDDVFNKYILPEKPMTASALKVTGLRVEGGKLLHHGSPVPTVPLRDALSQFLAWLRNVAINAAGRKPLLLAYNSRKFDEPVLKFAFKKTGLNEEAQLVIGGFADVFLMAISTIPKWEVGNYRLETLSRRYLSADYQAHNALSDAKALKGVYKARLAGEADVMDFRSPY